MEDEETKATREEQLKDIRNGLEELRGMIDEFLTSEEPEKTETDLNKMNQAEYETARRAGRV